MHACAVVNTCNCFYYSSKVLIKHFQSLMQVDLNNNSDLVSCFTQAHFKLDYILQLGAINSGPV